ncbi:MAG: phosphate ABC transporter permease PstA [Chloroflexaceae bacterium]|nr:phosphate ABC transporter permease PstA [Chloroflexaceae bacterium]
MISSVKASAPRNYRQTTTINLTMQTLLVVATLLAVAPLLWITGYVLVVGGSALKLSFLTKDYEAPELATEGEVIEGFPGVEHQGFERDERDGPNLDFVARGGVLHGIVGTMIITGLALIIVVPIGLMAGVFLAEYPDTWVTVVVRFACDVLTGAPSIVVGVVAYVLLVRHLGFSALAGSLALTFLMVPTITRTTEEMLKLVPMTIRDAATALGSPLWYATFTVVLPAALPGIVTGVMLAFARGAGETAPLILTAFGNHTLSFDVFGPMHALPLIVYRFTDSPFPSEHTYAWGGAFVLTMIVLGANILVRVVTAYTQVKGR